MRFTIFQDSRVGARQYQQDRIGYWRAGEALLPVCRAADVCRVPLVTGTACSLLRVGLRITLTASSRPSWPISSAPSR